MLCCSILFVLGTEVEADHHGDDDHNTIRLDVAGEGQNRKHGNDHQRHNGLYFDKASASAWEIKTGVSFST